MKEIKKQVILLRMNMYTSWTIEAWHVKAALRNNGINVPEESIKIPEQKITGPNPDFQGKSFPIEIKVSDNDCGTKLKFIHHNRWFYRKKIENNNYYSLCPCEMFVSQSVTVHYNLTWKNLFYQ